MCPFHFCGEASAAELPGIPGMASAETDLCRGQHWKQGTESPRQEIHLGRKAGEMLKKFHLPPGLKKQGLHKKRNKHNNQLLKSCELFLVDKNSSFKQLFKVEKSLIDMS